MGRAPAAWPRPLEVFSIDIIPCVEHVKAASGPGFFCRSPFPPLIKSQKAREYASHFDTRGVSVYACKPAWIESGAP